MVRRYSIHAHEKEQSLYLLPSQLDWNSDNKNCTPYDTKSQREFSSTMFNLVGIIKTNKRELLQELEQDCEGWGGVGGYEALEGRIC